MMQLEDGPRSDLPDSEDWFVRAFSGDYLKIYGHRSDPQGQSEVRQGVQWLDLKKTHSVLDLCCGGGRHLRALQDCGLSAVGLDLSAELLRAAQQRRPDSQLVRGDMREIPFVQSFDAVFCFFTSFGYFSAREDHLAVLMGIARALRAQGRFLIDLPDRDYLEQHLIPTSERQLEERRICERRWLASDRVEKEIVVKEQDGAEQRYRESVRLFRFDEMQELLREVGLCVDRVYGSFEGEPHQVGVTPRMILVGERS